MTWLLMVEGYNKKKEDDHALFLITRVLWVCEGLPLKQQVLLCEVNLEWGAEMGCGDPSTL